MFTLKLSRLLRNWVPAIALAGALFGCDGQPTSTEASLHVGGAVDRVTLVDAGFDPTLVPEVPVPRRGVGDLVQEVPLPGLIEGIWPVPTAPRLSSSYNTGPIGSGNPGGLEGNAADGTVRVVRTFHGHGLQIDRIDGGPGNANLVRGDDPVTGAPSRDLPALEPQVPFVDWDDLAADRERYQIRDAAVTSGHDATVFADGADCVMAGAPDPVGDLRWAAASSNRSYAYLAIERALSADSNTNSAEGRGKAVSWLFTRLPPRLVAGGSGCASGASALRYDLRPGDVMIAAVQREGSPVSFRAFTALEGEDDAGAAEALRLVPQRWSEQSAALVGAINSEPVSAGHFGDGSPAFDNPNLPTAARLIAAQHFIEVAVPLPLLAGTSACGSRLYGSVISHDALSDAGPGLLHDLVGPAIYDFSALRATAHLEPTCAAAATWRVDNVIGTDGYAVESPVCDLRFDSGARATQCQGAIPLPVGRHGGTATVVDPASGCALDLPLEAVDVYEPLSAVASVQPTCAGALLYSAEVHGGRPGAAHDFLWRFAQGDLPPSFTSIEPAGIIDVSTSGIDWRALLEVTEQRGPLACQASAAAYAAPLLPPTVEIVPSMDGKACATPEEYAVKLEARVTNGSAAMRYEWDGASCEGPVCMVMDSTGQACEVREIRVRVSDAGGLCPGAEAHVKWVKKSEVRVVR